MLEELLVEAAAYSIGSAGSRPFFGISCCAQQLRLGEAFPIGPTLRGTG